MCSAKPVQTCKNLQQFFDVFPDLCQTGVWLKQILFLRISTWLGRAWASPTVMWLTEASAMHYGAYVHGTFLQWLKSHRHATGTSTSLLLTCQLCFQVHNFCVNLHGFAFRNTLHISQDVICWQSWSNNNSKYGLVRRTYTIYYGRTRCFRASWRINFAFDNSCSYIYCCS